MRSDRELLKDALFLIESGSRGGTAYDITEEIRARLAESEDDPVRLSDEEIREIFISNGFTIKDGHSDLKSYVFNAARAIEKAVFEKNK